MEEGRERFTIDQFIVHTGIIFLTEYIGILEGNKFS